MSNVHVTHPRHWGADWAQALREIEQANLVTRELVVSDAEARRLVCSAFSYFKGEEQDNGSNV